MTCGIPAPPSFRRFQLSDAITLNTSNDYLPTNLTVELIIQVSLFDRSFIIVVPFDN